MADDSAKKDGTKNYYGYRTQRSLYYAVRASRLSSRNRMADNTPKPTNRPNFDRHIISRIKAGYIAGPEVATVEEMGTDLAQFHWGPAVGADKIALGIGHIKLLFKAEDWRGARERYWKNLEERMLLGKVKETVADFEAEMNVVGRRAVQKAAFAIEVLEPKDVTEAALLLKLGTDIVYRANRVPNRISRYLNIGDNPQSDEQQAQKMPKDDYAATARSGLAALTAEVGAGPPAAGDDRR